MKTLALLSAGLALWLTGVASAATPQIIDGGFEDIAVPFNTARDVTGQNIGGWQDGGTIFTKKDIVSGGFQFDGQVVDGPTPFGNQYLELGNGKGNSFYANESQVITDLTPGTTYAISLYYVGLYGNIFPNIFGRPAQLDLQVLDGSGFDGSLNASAAYLLTDAGPYGPKTVLPMEKATIQFVASSDAATFRMTNYSNQLLLGIDNVSLTQISSAPEPSTWALSSLAIGLIGGALRARKKTTSLLA